MFGTREDVGKHRQRDVRAAQHQDHPGSAPPVRVSQHRRHGERGRALDHDRLLVRHPPDRGAELGFGDADPVGHQLPTQRKRDRAGLEQAERGVRDRRQGGQLQQTAGPHALDQYGAGKGLASDDAYVRSMQREVGRDAGDQAAAPRGHEHAIEALELTPELDRDGALPTDYLGVVVRRHVRAAAVRRGAPRDGLHQAGVVVHQANPGAA